MTKIFFDWPPGSEIELHVGAIPATETQQLFDVLDSEIDWKQEHIRMFGDVIPLPRLTAWFGDPGRSYTYSGIAMRPKPWTPTLTIIRKIAEETADALFNSVLCNKYRDGSDSLAWHSDDEPELGHCPTIASVNFGAIRDFSIRSKADHKRKETVSLGPGDILVMRGRTQELCEHSVPKRPRGVHGNPDANSARINLTFRTILA